MPASYTANETATVINVGSGDVGFMCMVRVNTAFNGSGTDAIIIVGDGDDPNGYLENGNVDETTAGSVSAGGGVYYSTEPKVYTAADTVDIGFTANTAGTRNAGAIDLRVMFLRSNW